MMNNAKIISFLRHPHIPWILEKPIRSNFPRLHRLLKYYTIDPSSKKYWNGIWREEGLSTWRTYPNLFDNILSRVRYGCKVLDVGCGPGILLRKFRQELNCECFGLDISSVGINLLRQMNIFGVVGSLPKISFKAFSFDAVIATEVLEHVQNHLETLQEMKRVCKPGGLVICSVPNECMTKEECDEHLHNFNIEIFSNLLAALGDFKILTVDDKGGPRLLGIINITSKNDSSNLQHSLD